MFGAYQDSVYQAMQQEIIELKAKYSDLESINEKNADLEQRIIELEQQIQEMDSDRDYTTHLITYISIGLLVLVLALGLVLPQGILERVKNLRKNVNEKLDKNEIKIIEVRTTVHRAMYKMSYANNEFMLVVWGGRWMRDLTILNDYISDATRVNHIGINIKEIWNKLNGFNDSLLMALAQFENLPGTKRIYHDLENFNDKKLRKDDDIKIIRETAKLILAKIYEAENSFGAGPKGLDTDDVSIIPPGATGAGG